MELEESLKEIAYFGAVISATAIVSYSAEKVFPNKDSTNTNALESVLLPFIPDYFLYESGKKPKDISKYHLSLSIGMFTGQVLAKLNIF